MHVLLAAVAVYHGGMALGKIAMRHHVSKPNGHRFGNATGIKQNEIICGQFLQLEELSLLSAVNAKLRSKNFCRFTILLYKKMRLLTRIDA